MSQLPAKQANYTSILV